MVFGYSQKGLYIPRELDVHLENGVIRHIEFKIQNIERTSIIYNKNYISNLSRNLKSRGVTHSIHSFPYLNLAEKIGRIRQMYIDLFIEILDIAEYIESSWVTFHLGTCGFSSIEAYRDRKMKRIDFAIDSVIEILNRIKGYTIKLGIENVPHLPKYYNKCYVGDSLYEIEYVIKNINSDKVGIVFDIGHANINKGMDVGDYLIALLNKLYAIHLHWNNGTYDSHSPLLGNHRNRIYWQLIDRVCTIAKTGIPLIIENEGIKDTLLSIEYIESL